MMVYFASFLSYDSLPAQERELEDGIPISSAQLGILYSIYNFPNTFMVILGGVLFDSLGVRKSIKFILFYLFIYLNLFLF